MTNEPQINKTKQNKRRKKKNHEPNADTNKWYGSPENGNYIHTFQMVRNISNDSNSKQLEEEKERDTNKTKQSVYHRIETVMSIYV